MSLRWLRDPRASGGKSWFLDATVRKFYKNFGVLLGSNAVAAIFDLVGFTVTARSLGASALGDIVLIHAYFVTIDTLLNFNSSDVVVKYSATALQSREDADFKTLVKFGSVLDALSAFLGTVVSLGGLVYLSHLLDWTQGKQSMAAVYCLTVAFNWSQTPLAVLKIFDRFDSIAKQRVWLAFLKLALIVVASLNGSSAWTYLYIWMANAILGHLVPVVIAYRELARRDCISFHRSSIRQISQTFPRIWSFAFSTNLNSTVRIATQDVDTLLVGGLLGSGPAGVFQIAKLFGTIPARISAPVFDAIYPDLSRFWIEGDVTTFRQWITRVSAVLGVAGLVLWIFFACFGARLISLLIGQEFSGAYLPLLAYLAAYIVVLIGTPIYAGVLSMGHPERVLTISFTGVFVYFALLFGLTQSMGIVGSALAQLAFWCFTLCGVAISFALYLRRYAGK